jgi:hypothetical protein
MKENRLQIALYKFISHIQDNAIWNCIIYVYLATMKENWLHIAL